LRERWQATKIVHGEKLRFKSTRKSPPSNKPDEKDGFCVSIWSNPPSTAPAAKKNVLGVQLAEPTELSRRDRNLHLTTRTTQCN
jgi:hypothetical protein